MAGDVRHQQPRARNCVQSRGSHRGLRDVAPGGPARAENSRRGDRRFGTERRSLAEVTYWGHAVLDGLAGLTRESVVSPGSLHALAGRMRVFVDRMRFEFLYDRRRRLFAIGYRLEDANGPGLLDRVFYDLLASEDGSPASWRLPRKMCPRTLVPPRASGDQHRRPRRADLLGRHPVRIPDAAAHDAQLPRHAARPELPRRRAAADRVPGGNGAYPGEFRSRPTRSPTATARISTVRSACLALVSGEVSSPTW